jgi:hypothetical protein
VIASVTTTSRVINPATVRLGDLMPLRKILKAALMLTLATVAMRVPSGADEMKESACGKQPVLMPGPKPTKEEQQKACKLRADGLVAISISEEGDVVNATVVRTLSRDAAEALLTRARSMKFQPRPGCGILKITVNYSLAGKC